MVHEQMPFDWEEELAREAALRQRLYELSTDETKGSKPARRTAARNWFAQLSRIMSFCVTESRQGEFVHKPPIEVWHILSALTDDLSRGLLREPITDVKGRGHPKMSKPEVNAVGCATLYLWAVKTGRIEDPHPIKTIQTVYGIRRQTAQKWKELAVPEELESLRHDPEQLEREMREQGQRYSFWGRSSQAIKSRG